MQIASNISKETRRSVKQVYHTAFLAGRLSWSLLSLYQPAAAVGGLSTKSRWSPLEPPWTACARGYARKGAVAHFGQIAPSSDLLIAGNQHLEAPSFFPSISLFLLLELLHWCTSSYHLDSELLPSRLMVITQKRPMKLYPQLWIPHISARMHQQSLERRRGQSPKLVGSLLV